jgi:hypothetical protein
MFVQRWRRGLKWRFDDSKSKKWRIAIAGIGKSVGVTHFSILLGAYFRYQEGKKVCIVDLSGESDYMDLENLYFGHRLEQSEGYVYSIHKLDFLVGEDADSLIRKALQGKYEVVIFDCGTKAALLEGTLALCDRKYVLGYCSPWNQRQWDLYFATEPCMWEERKRLGYRYGYSLGVEENAHALEGRYQVRLVHIPFIEDPFRIRREQLRRLQEIIWEEKYL